MNGVAMAIIAFTLLAMTVSGGAPFPVVAASSLLLSTPLFGLMVTRMVRRIAALRVSVTETAS